MDSQKLENILNLSLEVSGEERERSLELDVGVEEDRWELIVKYHGNLEEALSRAAEEIEGEGGARQAESLFQAEYLLPGYAILTVDKNNIPLLSRIQEIDYVEKPKALYEGAISISQGKLESCIQEVTGRPPGLTGEGCLIGVPDSGIAYKDRAFLDENGQSRILYLWDQTQSPDRERGYFPPRGFHTGVEFSGQQLNDSIVTGEELTFDRSGHGTGVTAIAAGREGAAPKAGLLIVKLGSGNSQGFSRTTELMRAVAWMLQKSGELQRPLAINISYGSTYGSHDGTSLLETFLDTAADSYKTVICVGSGNEGAAAGHIQLILREGEEARVECNIVPYQRSCNISLWKNYADTFELTLVSPGGERNRISLERMGKQEITAEGTKIILYCGEPTPYAKVQEYYFDFLGEPYISTGVWTFLLRPLRILQGNCSFYLPSAEAVNQGTNFFRPTPSVTLTIPATAQKVITVGAYNTVFDEYADFSGRGYPLYGEDVPSGAAGNVAAAEGLFYYMQQMKPDICAPGVDILVPDGLGSYNVVSGTSFAAPFVTGSAALLMEWGVVRGNDPYLYGEKVKAYLIKGAKQLPGFERYPNEMVGWGTLCVGESIPRG